MDFRGQIGVAMLTLLGACKTPEIEVKPEVPSVLSDDALNEPIGVTRSEVDEVLKEPTPEELALETLQQESFKKTYGSRYPDLFGSKLYSNQELLSPGFKPEGVYEGEIPSVRFLQFFLKNGRDATFSSAEQLGAKHHETLLTSLHPISRVFSEAGIDLQGEHIDWVEVDSEMKSGSLDRLAKEYGGKDESIMLVARRSPGLSPWIEQSAHDAGYVVEPSKSWESVVNNEMSHEIQQKYFPALFSNVSQDFSEPFKSFRSKVPGLRFKTNHQAGEFLSDVADWASGGFYFRFFNSLYYMDSCSEYYGGETDQYAYSYAVQRYAMKQVLHEKGYKQPDKIINDLIQTACDSSYDSHPEFEFARRYFTEEDFVKIGQIYREIGVELLKTMKPYYVDPTPLK